MTTEKNATDVVDKIRSLNDQFRTTFKGGHIMVTRGISERCDTNAILAAVQTFDKFCKANDPYGEHDFGAFEVGVETIFWKLDYYSKDMVHGSPDATDPAVTERVLTIMLAQEY